MEQNIFSKIKDLYLKKKRLINVLIASFICIILLILFTLFYLIPQNKYKEGLSLIESKEYDKAISVFYDLEDFKDSKEKVFEATVLKAFTLYDKGKIEESINLLKTIGKEEEVYERIYKSALNFYNKKEFDKSNPFFILLGDYKDSKSYIHYHEFIEIERKEATCNTDGYIKTYCKGCDTEVLEKIKKTGVHEYEIVEKVDATCVSNGIIKYSCIYCGRKTSEKLNALGHNYIVEETTATCLEKGVTKKECDRCHDVVLTEAPSLGHDYIVISDTSTCVSDGKVKYECSRCKDTYEEDTIAIGHDMVDATCTTKAHCKNCDYEEGDILGHTTHNGKCDRCLETIFFFDYSEFIVTNTLPLELEINSGDSKLVIKSVDFKKNETGGKTDPNNFVIEITYQYDFITTPIENINIYVEDENGVDYNTSVSIWGLTGTGDQEKIVSKILPLLELPEVGSLDILSHTYEITLSLE